MDHNYPFPTNFRESQIPPSSGSRRIHLDDHPNDKGVQLMWWLAHRKKYIHENNRWPPSLTKISKYFAAQKKTRKNDSPVSPLDDNGDPIITNVDDIGKEEVNEVTVPIVTEDYPDGYPDHEPGHIHKNGSYNPIMPSNSHFDLSDMKARSLLPFNEQKGFLHLDGKWHPNADFTLSDFMFIRSMSWKALKIAFPALGNLEMAAMEELRQDLLRSGTRVGLEMQTWLRNNMGSIATEISRDGVAYISETRLLTVQSIDEIADIADEIQQWNRLVQTGAIQASQADIEHATRLFQMCQRRREQTIAAIQEHELGNVAGIDAQTDMKWDHINPIDGEQMRGVPVGGEHGMQTEENLIFERRNIIDQGQRDRSMAAAESQRDEALAAAREARDAEIAASNVSGTVPTSSSVGADVGSAELQEQLATQRAAINSDFDTRKANLLRTHRQQSIIESQRAYQERRFKDSYDIEGKLNTSEEAYGNRLFADEAGIAEMNDEQLARAYRSFYEEANWQVQDTGTGKWVAKQDVDVNKAQIARQMDAPSMDPNIPSDVAGGRVQGVGMSDTGGDFGNVMDPYRGPTMEADVGNFEWNPTGEGGWIDEVPSSSNMRNNNPFKAKFADVKAEMNKRMNDAINFNEKNSISTDAIAEDPWYDARWNPNEVPPQEVLARRSESALGGMREQPPDAADAFAGMKEPDVQRPSELGVDDDKMEFLGDDDELSVVGELEEIEEHDMISPAEERAQIEDRMRVAYDKTSVTDERIINKSISDERKEALAAFDEHAAQMEKNRLAGNFEAMDQELVKFRASEADRINANYTTEETRINATFTESSTAIEASHEVDMASAREWYASTGVPADELAALQAAGVNPAANFNAPSADAVLSEHQISVELSRRRAQAIAAIEEMGGFTEEQTLAMRAAGFGEADMRQLMLEMDRAVMMGAGLEATMAIVGELTDLGMMVGAAYMVAQWSIEFAQNGEVIVPDFEVGNWWWKDGHPYDPKARDIITSIFGDAFGNNISDHLGIAGTGKQDFSNSYEDFLESNGYVVDATYKLMEELHGKRNGEDFVFGGQVTKPNWRDRRGNLVNKYDLPDVPKEEDMENWQKYQHGIVYDHKHHSIDDDFGLWFRDGFFWLLGGGTDIINQGIFYPDDVATITGDYDNWMKAEGYYKVYDAEKTNVSFWGMEDEPMETWHWYDSDGNIVKGKDLPEGPGEFKLYRGNLRVSDGYKDDYYDDDGNLHMGDAGKRTMEDPLGMGDPVNTDGNEVFHYSTGGIVGTRESGPTD